MIDATPLWSGEALSAHLCYRRCARRGRAPHFHHIHHNLLCTPARTCRARTCSVTIHRSVYTAQAATTHQKQLCPLSHGSVPFEQSQPNGIYFQCPVIGNCWWCRTLSALLFHGSSWESIAFREGG